MSTVSLFKAFVQGMTDYIAKHNANYSTIESNLNYILGILTGQTGGDLAVPQGLKEIFDRPGLVGIGSYDFNEGALSGPDYLLSVSGGAFWNGSDFLHKNVSTGVSFAGKATGTYYLYIDSGGTPAASDKVETNTVRTCHWDSATHVISDKQLYTGVAILFDGDDYADMLTSAVKSTTYTKVADRLEAIEQGQDVFSGYYAQDLPHSGLNFKYKAGKVRNDSVITDTPAGQVALTNAATNYVEVNPADGTVSANTTSFTSGRIPLYQVTTAGGAIGTVTDKRTPAIAGTGGGGGGHTQNTDTGTTADTFTIDSDASGSPTGWAGIEVENGDDPNALLKFNRDTGRWQYSEDGGASWKNLGEPDLSLGTQEFSKYMPHDNPPQVYYETERGSSSDYEPIDLSSYLGTPQFGVKAVLLRVFFRDNTPGINTKVLFRKGSGPYSPGTAFTVWSDESDAEPKPADLIIPLGDEDTVDFYVYASGTDTATLQIFLLGYFETIYGVGTQEKTLSQTGLNVAANSSQQFNLTAFLNRGLAHYLKIEETGGLVTGTYDVEIYEEDTFTTLLYKAEGIIPGTPYEDWLPFWLKDADGTRELHLKIDNNDLSQQGTYKITLKTEMFD